MKRVLITGASSDIGVATCQRYQSAGWHVVGHYRNRRAELDQLKGQQFSDWKCDFSDLTSLKTDLKHPEFDLNSIDAFVNLAAELSPGKFSATSSVEILNALNINLLPGLLITKIIGPWMVKRGFGRIVHGSSIGVKFGGGVQNFAYSLSKHAQEFIPQECLNWAQKNVFINIARIGVTNTRIHDKVSNKDMAARVKLIPAGRLADPAEIAEALFWLGSENNSFTTGEIVTIAGGE